MELGVASERIPSGVRHMRIVCRLNGNRNTQNYLRPNVDNTHSFSEWGWLRFSILEDVLSQRTVTAIAFS
jgi:hypothetical protein